MQFQTEAKRLADPEEMAKVYLARYYGNEEIEYPINPFQMLKDEGILFSLRDFKKLEGVYIPQSGDTEMKEIDGEYLEVKTACHSGSSEMI